MSDWVFIEVGGSSTRSSVERDGVHRFFPGVLRRAGARYALAVPGVIRPPKVLYATNLGWPDVADPGHELVLADVGVLANDAVAAGLGEAVLRAGGHSGALPDLLYLSLGTGVGTALLLRGAAVDADMGHVPVGGKNYCEGCRTHGCLNSEIEAKRLSRPVTEAEVATIVSTLATAIEKLWERGTDSPLVVVSGGITAANPSIVPGLAEATGRPVEGTLAPPEAKSAAFMGLHRLAADLDAHRGGIDG